jgi:predicted amidohydrolase
MLLGTGAAHWEVLLRARAIECQCYVVAAAQAGVHNSKRESYGHALIIDPWGVVVAALPDPSETGSRGAAAGQDEDYILCFIWQLVKELHSG